ncbi:Bet v1-like protein [Dioscorea alata]|uniref:Bet v1-like protein n=1 Tax=Dioscorea alata TaxID=55571 RepID=A0ACB7VQ24_DIOAL|nr:Bet v1-like protein [Dioscorea alata]
MTSTIEIETAVPASRMFKAAFLEWHNLAPKVVPDHIKSASAVHVDGGVGSVRQINFTPGGDLGTKLESLCTHFKFTPTSSGGSTCKVTTTYKVLPGVTPGDEEAKAKEGLTNTIKATEAYLLANPSVCA